MSALGSLVVKLGLDTATFEQGMTRSEHLAARAMRQVEGESRRGLGAVRQQATEAADCMQRLNERLDQTATLVKAWGLVNYVAAPLLAVASASVDAADRLHNLANRTGLATETLSALGYAARQNDSDLEQLAGGLKKLSTMMFDAASGNTRAGQTFKALGVSARELKSMNIEAVLGRLADLTKALPADARVAFLDNLKKGLGELAPLLANGADGLAELTEQAHRVGAVMSAETAAAATAYKDQLQSLRDTLSGVSSRIYADFLPGMTASVAGLQQAVLWAEAHRDAIAATAALLVGGLLARGLGGWAQGLANGAAAAYQARAAALAEGAAKVQSAQSSLAAAQAALAHEKALLAENLAAARSAKTMADKALLARTAVVPAKRAVASASEAAAAAETRLAAAQAAAARSTSVARGAITALGGPLGAVITLLGLGATAWLTFGNNAEASARRAGASAEWAKGKLQELQNLERFGAGDLGEALKRLEAAQARLRQLEDAPAHSMRNSRWRTARGNIEATKRDIAELEELVARLRAAEQAQKGAAERSARELEELLGRFNSPDGISGAVDALDALDTLLARLSGRSAGLEAGYAKDLQTLYAAWQQGRLSVDQYRQAVEQLIAQQPFARDLARAHAEAIREQEKALADYHAAWDKHLGGLSEQAQRLEQELELYGLTEVQIARVNLRRAEERVELARANGVAAAYLRKLEEEVELRRRIVASAAGLDGRRAAEEAARAAAEEWQRTADSIEQSLTDALLRGFEDGKGFAQNFRDTLKNMFRTLVLRPLIQPVMAGVAGTIAGAVSGGGASGAGNIGLSALGSAAGSLFGAGGLSGAMMAGAGWLTGATTLSGSLAAAGSLIGAGGAGITSGLAMGAGALAPIALPLLAIGLLSGAFGSKKKPDQRGAVDIDLATGSLTHVGRSPGDKKFSQQNFDAANALGAYALDLTALLRQITGTPIKRDMHVGVGDRTGIRAWLDDPAATRRFDSSDALVDWITDELLAGVIGDLPEKYAAVAASMRGAGDEIMGVFRLMVDDFGVLRSEAENFTLAQENLSKAFRDLGVRTPQSIAEFRRLANSIDLTTTEGRELYQNLYGLAPAFAELSRVIDDVFASISKSTAQSVRDIEISILDKAGKYAYLDADTDRLLGELSQATDPRRINELFESVNRNITQAFNLLDDVEQKRLATQFIDRLYEAESIAHSRLRIEPLDRSWEEQADAAAEQRAAAADQRAAAREQQEAAAEARRAAADLRAALAAIPSRIVVDNTVRVVASETGY